MPFLYYYKNR